MSFISFDLPSLNTIHCNSSSLHNVDSLSISSILHTLSLADVPFNNGNYSVKKAFYRIQSNSITCDEGKTE